MRDPIIGSEALANGTITRGQLRWNYRPIFPGVYLAKPVQMSLRTNTVGAWLWSGRRGVIAGRAAAALHTAKWVDDFAPIELIWTNNHYPPGTIVRDERIADDEVVRVRGMLVTTPARTAFDLGRHLPRGLAIAHLDALARATGITAADVAPLTLRHRGARGVRQCQTALSLMDRGSESPKESWLRLVLIDAGLPQPVTQIRVTDGHTVAYLDWGYLPLAGEGWDEPKVAVEYDGDQHRTDRGRYVKDIRRTEMVEGLGWKAIKVVNEDRPNIIVRRVYDALARRSTAGSLRRDRTQCR